MLEFTIRFSEVENTSQTKDTIVLYYTIAFVLACIKDKNMLCQTSFTLDLPN